MKRWCLSAFCRQHKPVTFLVTGLPSVVSQLIPPPMGLFGLRRFADSGQYRLLFRMVSDGLTFPVNEREQRAHAQLIQGGAFVVSSILELPVQIDWQPNRDHTVRLLGGVVLAGTYYGSTAQARYNSRGSCRAQCPGVHTADLHGERRNRWQSLRDLPNVPSKKETTQV